jgi:L-malate glycosyltransferase
MKIGICAPVDCSTFENYLYEKDMVKVKGLGLGGSQVNQIVNELLERGYHLSIFTLDKSIEEGKEITVCGDNLTVYIGSFRRNKMCAIDFQKVERRYLEKVIKEDKPDIVHAHWTYEFALGAINSGIPHIISVRDWAPTILKLMPNPYRVIRLLMNYYVFFKGKNFVANSLYIDKKIDGLVKNKFDLVPNAIKDEDFIKTQKFLNTKTKKIVSISNGFGKLKNVPILLKAFEKVKNTLPCATLILIGKDFEKDGAAHQWVKTNSDDANIEFLGEMPHKEIFHILKDCDLLVHPALEESFGNTLIEAMSQKVPVIGGKDSGAVPWVLSDSGILIDITNVDIIVKEIVEILQNEEKWSKYSKYGYQKAYKEFRLSSIVDRYLNHYNSILGLTGSRT